jgi:ADP-ribose pyrophosphatase YjhB (NUDIX family)
MVDSVANVATAPEWVRHCVRCGSQMTTDEVQGTQRRRCPACGHTHYPDPKVAVGAAVFRAGELLLVRRVMQPGQGKWALPGGFLDAGEDPRAAVVRETAEEAGVDVEVGEVLEVFANPPAEGGALFVLFAAQWVAGEPKPGDDADAAGFFGRDELPLLAFASTEWVVRRWPG